MAITDELAALREQTLAAIEAAVDTAALDAVRVGVIGKAGTLTGYLRNMGQVAKEQRAEGPGNAITGVGRGVVALGGGIAHGLAGLVYQPVRGAQKDGAFVTGPDDADFYRFLGDGVTVVVSAARGRVVQVNFLGRLPQNGISIQTNR